MEMLSSDIRQVGSSFVERVYGRKVMYVIYNEQGVISSIRYADGSIINLKSGVIVKRIGKFLLLQN